MASRDQASNSLEIPLINSIPSLLKVSLSIYVLLLFKTMFVGFIASYFGQIGRVLAFPLLVFGSISYTKLTYALPIFLLKLV